VMFTHGAGLDVHKKTVMACRVTPDPTGEHADGMMELKALGAMTVDLLVLSDWLATAGITHVAIESTGEYWKPLYNLLEGDVMVFLVNAAHVKQVPGRQTGKADARWLAKFMRYGLLRARFIPPREQRDWRDRTRYRTKLVQEPSREVNRVPGVLERANIKLASHGYYGRVGPCHPGYFGRGPGGPGDHGGARQTADAEQDAAAGAGLDRVGSRPSVTGAGHAVGPYRFPGRAD
jgi:hypothetical protein